MADLPQIEIEYCRQCRWLLRAGWMAQELLVTFEDELGGAALVPGSAPIATSRFVAPAVEPGSGDEEKH
jgi:selenoprotein W-related protein